MFKSILPFILCFFFLISPSRAEDKITQKRVTFEAGKTNASVKDSLQGWEGVDYLLTASAGQKMVVNMKGSNPQNYFNVWAPGSDEAMFIGSVSGDRFEAVLPTSGDYRIQVYLMRSAARRGEKTSYSLDISVTGVAN